MYFRCRSGRSPHSLRKWLSGRSDCLQNGHDFPPELIEAGCFVRSPCGRLSRFVMNNDVLARITFALSVDTILSSNEWFASDISGLREARVRERSSVPYRCFTSFGKAALIRHNQMRTTKYYMVGESFSSSVICSLCWVKLHKDRRACSRQMPWVFVTSLVAAHSVVTNSQSTRLAFGHSPLEIVWKPMLLSHMTSNSCISSVESLDDEVVARSPLTAFNDIAVRPARRAVTIRGTLCQ